MAAATNTVTAQGWVFERKATRAAAQAYVVGETGQARPLWARIASIERLARSAQPADPKTKRDRPSYRALAEALKRADDSLPTIAKSHLAERLGGHLKWCQERGADPIADDFPGGEDRAAQIGYIQAVTRKRAFADPADGNRTGGAGSHVHSSVHLAKALNALESKHETNESVGLQDWLEYCRKAYIQLREKQTGKKAAAAS